MLGLLPWFLQRNVLSAARTTGAGGGGQDTGTLSTAVAVRADRRRVTRMGGTKGGGRLRLAAEPDVATGLVVDRTKGGGDGLDGPASLLTGGRALRAIGPDGGIKAGGDDEREAARAAAGRDVGRGRAARSLVKVGSSSSLSSASKTSRRALPFQTGEMGFELPAIRVARDAMARVRGKVRREGGRSLRGKAKGSERDAQRRHPPAPTQSAQRARPRTCRSSGPGDEIKAKRLVAPGCLSQRKSQIAPSAADTPVRWYDS
jgi:hypothetical protein